jgi:hypothetical protein
MLIPPSRTLTSTHLEAFLNADLSPKRGIVKSNAVRIVLKVSCLESFLEAKITVGKVMQLVRGRWFAWYDGESDGSFFEGSLRVSSSRMDEHS